MASHPTINGIPTPWTKNEEYYYWGNGYLNSANNDLLKVEQTIGPNGMANTYDSSRTVAWHRTLANNSAIFYTSLGHSNSNYTSDTLFQNLILNATRWCLNLNTILNEVIQSNEFKLYPNPVKDALNFEPGNNIKSYSIFNIKGQEVTNDNALLKNESQIDLINLKKGIYYIRFQIGDKTVSKKFIKS